MENQFPETPIPSVESAAATSGTSATSATSVAPIGVGAESSALDRRISDAIKKHAAASPSELLTRDPKLRASLLWGTSKRAGAVGYPDMMQALGGSRYFKRESGGRSSTFVFKYSDQLASGFNVVIETRMPLVTGVCGGGAAAAEDNHSALFTRRIFDFWGCDKRRRAVEVMEWREYISPNAFDVISDLRVSVGHALFLTARRPVCPRCLAFALYSKGEGFSCPRCRAGTIVPCAELFDEQRSARRRRQNTHGMVDSADDESDRGDYGARPLDDVDMMSATSRLGGGVIFPGEHEGL